MADLWRVEYTDPDRGYRTDSIVVPATSSREAIVAAEVYIGRHIEIKSVDEV